VIRSTRVWIRAGVHLRADTAIQRPVRQYSACNSEAMYAL
jgi:hypothetical protein